MIFPTVKFAIFFSLVLPASWRLMRRRGAWHALMLVASYVFYGFAGWSYTLLLATSTVANQFFAIGIDRSRTQRSKRTWLAFAVVFNLGALAYYKYANLFLSSSNNLFHDLGLPLRLPLASIALPAAISFFTFQALSYDIDTFRGKIRPAPFLDFAVYLSFFPHLLAGPIVRAAEFLPQLKTARDPHRVDSGLAFWLIAGGLFKKVVIATYLANFVKPVFENPGTHSGPEVLLATYAFAVQIYMDFSAYTDIAIGIALLLGFRFPQNFNEPYRALSLQDFWRRWHMTLSRWLRDYLYVPLGGNRRGRVRAYTNLMLTMLLGGLWHGASWMMLIWGAIHGAGLAVERFFQDLAKRRRQRREEREATREARALQALELAVAGASRWTSYDDGAGDVADTRPGNGDEAALAFERERRTDTPATTVSRALATVGSTIRDSLVWATTNGSDTTDRAGNGDGNGNANANANATSTTHRAGTDRANDTTADTMRPAGTGRRNGNTTRTIERNGHANGHGNGNGHANGDAAARVGGNGSTPSGEPARRERGIGTWIRWIITFNVVCAAWIFFWQGIPGNDGSLNNAIETFKRLAHWGSGLPFNPVLIGVIAIALLLQFTPPELSGRLRAAFSRLSIGWQAIGLALVLLITTVLFHKISPSGIAPFIYFKF